MINMTAPSTYRNFVHQTPCNLLKSYQALLQKPNDCRLGEGQPKTWTPATPGGDWRPLFLAHVPTIRSQMAVTGELRKAFLSDLTAATLRRGTLNEGVPYQAQAVRACVKQGLSVGSAGRSRQLASLLLCSNQSLSCWSKPFDTWVSSS